MATKTWFSHEFSQENITKPIGPSCQGVRGWWRGRSNCPHRPMSGRLCWPTSARVHCGWQHLPSRGGTEQKEMWGRCTIDIKMDRCDVHIVPHHIFMRMYVFTYSDYVCVSLSLYLSIYIYICEWCYYGRPNKLSGQTHTHKCKSNPLQCHCYLFQFSKCYWYWRLFCF